jgi:hypothetical protein
MPLLEFEFPERSALLLGQEQEERSYPFDRFLMLQASESLLLQDSESPH